MVIGLERENGAVSRYETWVLPEADADGCRFLERTVKFLMWARGGWRLWLGGPGDLCRAVASHYTPSGARAFDCELLGRIYERALEVHCVRAEEVPEACEKPRAVGGHLDGCRLGFDLGASDFKVAAVLDGEVVYSDEFPWEPKVQADPEYHFTRLQEGLVTAASHLPRVDAIGGSSAGVIVNNRFMVASLLRAIPAERMEHARNLFLRVRELWGVPLEVANDGDVTALAGTMSSGGGATLGVAMGSSEAAGYIDRQGCVTGWLNELAFSPVDLNPQAAAEEWSGDRGVGALYFSQQSVNRLLPAAGVKLDAAMGLPEKLKAVQELMTGGDPRAERIYRTIGVCFGYAAAHYAEFYDFDHLLVLGRVTTGYGGELLLGEARGVLEREFPDLAGRFTVEIPDEKSRRVGQAIAAASLPVIGSQP